MQDAFIEIIRISCVFKLSKNCQIQSPRLYCLWRQLITVFETLWFEFMQGQTIFIFHCLYLYGVVLAIGLDGYGALDRGWCEKE